MHGAALLGASLGQNAALRPLSTDDNYQIVVPFCIGVLKPQGISPPVLIWAIVGRFAIPLRL